MNEHTNSESHQDRLEAATSGRLASLRRMPVDLSSLQHAVEAQIPRPRSRMVPGMWLRLAPLRAMAASLLVLGLIGAVVLMAASGPALASTDRLLAVHEAVVGGEGHGMAVQSIEGANEALSRRWPDAPPLPAVGHEEVMSCCVHRVGRQKVACAAVKIDGVAVSLAVADASDIKIPDGQRIERNGVTYHVQSARGINMAMTERDGRWACLMGALPVDRLIEMLNTLKW